MSGRTVFGKMENFVAQSPADNGDFSLAYNLSTIVSLASDNGTKNGYDDYGYYKARFNPAGAIVIVGILSFVFFIAFCCTCLCRRSITGDGSRAFRRAMGNDNARTTTTTTRGLARGVIESFPVFSYDLVKGLKAQAKGSECAVCLSDFQDDEMVRLLPKCRHAFHPECIDLWLSSHTTCPVCRTSLEPADESDPSGISIAVPEDQAIVDNGTLRVDVGDAGAAEASNATGEHSLVRVQKESEKGLEWYIATAEGLKPGFHKCYSSVDVDISEGASTSMAPPSDSKPDDCTNDPESRSSSDRWGNISMNPASFLRTFSERGARPRGDEQGGINEQTDRRAYLRRTVSWLRGSRSGSQRGSRSGSSRHVDPNVVV